ncbi:hypothetical protein IscW_ISCW011224 [Ixodes scapularis]|uniref:Uncharacterized protein n=1 Tax=Ixodes scapularis TaxID=6945 RepID=B7Q4T3_IXOSC|nr:hypothetical protein IscW_ISCW011224 [Ixodes scapularis]|eukprot:XP_002411620.1 hypothetical protein IscW_ISCW011224 [Ixodes scapularis]
MSVRASPARPKPSIMNLHHSQLRSRSCGPALNTTWSANEKNEMKLNKHNTLHILDVIDVDSPNLCGLDVIEGGTEERVDYSYISLYDKSTALGAGHAEQLCY